MNSSLVEISLQAVLVKESLNINQYSGSGVFRNLKTESGCIFQVYIFKCVQILA